MKRGTGNSEQGIQGQETQGQGTEDKFSAADPVPVIEIGAARSDEADSVLRVMCAAFELPFDVARPIFYADPYFDLDAKRVLRVEGRIVSCLTLSETLCRVGEAYVSVAGIAGLATLPAFQNRGHAARLLAATVELLRERHHPLVGLYPFRAEYYRRMGWEAVTEEQRCVIAPASLPAAPEAANVTGAEPQHLGAVARLYTIAPGRGCLSGARDEKRWRYLFERAPEKWVYLENGDPTGYMFCETQPGTLRVGDGRQATPPVLRVLEICAVTAEARRGLLGHLAARTAYGQIEYVSTPQNLRDAGLLDLSLRHEEPFPVEKAEPANPLMLRVADFPALLASLRPNWQGFQGTIALTLRDEQRPDVCVTVRVQGVRDALPMLSVERASDRLHAAGANTADRGADSEADIPQDRFNRGKRAAADPGEHAADAFAVDPFLAVDNIIDHVTGDARYWAKIAVGQIGGEAACALGLLRADTPRAARRAGILFPPRAPFLPALDHF